MKRETQDIRDEELLARCMTNEDPDAWESFVRRYSNLIWSSIHRTFRASAFPYASEDAEDVFGAVFLSLVEQNFKKLRQFRGRNDCKLSTWLTVVAVRKTIDHMRHRSRISARSLEDDNGVAESVADGRQTMDAALMEQQQAAALAGLVDSLTPQDRQLFEILRSEDHTAEEAARALGVTVPAFYTRKHRLVEKIKKTLNEL